MKKNKLTRKQLEKVNNDMNKQVEMLTDAEVNALALRVNESINLPLLKEKREFVVFVKIIKWIDKKLYQLIPNEYYELIKESTDGISKEEAILFEDRLTPLINNAVNIPILSEQKEEELIRMILSLIINAMVKGLKLEEVEIEK